MLLHHISIALFIVNFVASGLLKTEPAEDDSIKILTVGKFHSHEIWEGAENEIWFGLFQKNDTFFLKKTNIKIEPFFDNAIDKEGETTGKQISVTDNENCILLLTSLEVEERNVLSIPFYQSDLLPNNRIIFNHNQATYILMGMGLWQTLPEGQSTVVEYKLLFEKNVLGEVQNQIISKTDFFDDTMYEIIWIGDLDGDNEIDLLVNLSNHHNIKKITLLLSSYAKNTNLVEEVATFFSSGC